MRACAIFNPAAGPARLRAHRRALTDLGLPCDWRPTTAPGHASELAAAAAREGFDTVIAVGGDGTVGEVVDGLARTPGGLEATRLAVLPLGTMNVFARELGLPLHPRAAARVLAAGRERRVDLGCVECAGATGPVVRCFAQLAGAGLDSRAIARVSGRWKQRVGPLAYVWAGLVAWYGPQPLLELHAAGQTWRGTLVVMGNGRLYGGRVNMFPEARLDDGRLDARLFTRVTVFTLARFAWAWLCGRAVHAPGTVTLQSERFAITGGEPVPVEADGDNVGQLPAVFSVRPRALRVLGPP